MNNLYKLFAINTKILMHDRSFKLVQDIKVGDIIMGLDNEPYVVSKLKNGMDILYNVINGNNIYTVNGYHILNLKYCNSKTIKNMENEMLYRVIWFDNKILNIKIKDFNYNLYNKDDIFENALKFLKMVEEDLTVNISINLYNKLKPEIKTKLYNYIHTINFPETHTEMHPYLFGKYISTIVCDKSDKKFIPDEYKINSRVKRMQILGGLIDTSGRLNENNEFEFWQLLDDESIIDDTIYICKSLGLKVSKYICKKFIEDGWEINISGNGIQEIMVLNPYNELNNFFPKENRSNIIIGKQPRSKYYGFKLDNVSYPNIKVILDDFTVI